MEATAVSDGDSLAAEGDATAADWIHDGLRAEVPPLLEKAGRLTRLVCEVAHATIGLTANANLALSQIEQGEPAAAADMPRDDDVPLTLLERYFSECRELRSCEPRDLIERVRDICRYLDKPERITTDLVEIAWRRYCGNRA